MSRSEDMVLSFTEQNFSNLEIGNIFKLRSSRNEQYRDAFLTFKRNGKQDKLVEALKQVIIDVQAEEVNGEMDGQKMSHSNEIFQMVMSGDFEDEGLKETLRVAYEVKKDPSIFKIIDNHIIRFTYCKPKRFNIWICFGNISNP